MLIFNSILNLIYFFLIIIYFYISYVFMNIGKKAELNKPLLAWIPVIGPLIIAYKTSKMHWWPFLVLILLIFNLKIKFIFQISYAYTEVLIINSLLVLILMKTIWEWKMFEKINKPGWWAIPGAIFFIPILGIPFGIWYLFLLGVSAWSRKETNELEFKKSKKEKIIKKKIENKDNLTKKIEILSWIDLSIGVIPFIILFVFGFIGLKNAPSEESGFALIGFIFSFLFYSPFLIPNLFFSISSFQNLNKNIKKGIKYSIILKIIFLLILLLIFFLIIKNFIVILFIVITLILLVYTLYIKKELNKN